MICMSLFSRWGTIFVVAAVGFKKWNKVITQHCHGIVNLEVVNTVSEEFMQTQFKVL